jgi:hypothetical protein
MTMHPFEPDLSALKDSELEEKILELNKKCYQAARLGKQDLLTQLTSFVIMYKEEMADRYRKKFQNHEDDDLDQLINVD